MLPNGSELSVQPETRPNQTVFTAAPLQTKDSKTHLMDPVRLHTVSQIPIVTLGRSSEL
jgi:hypothetical protein